MHKPHIPNVHDDVMHMLLANVRVFIDMMKHYMITLHHSMLFAMYVRVCNVGWMTRACQILSAATTVFDTLTPVKHCCTLQ
jgi:hypothetical protein